ncbi:NYN domain-containing protein [Flavobacterium sp. MAH-1]|uniref:NYN domain-containing protein n=1 Tax=Flavobacterium agri TaxID=2743471 RepID=A0A7Y9C450_9FLAO|nr:NYN domain-containing protein [Flavobacterium agri]NUY79500.1 NYN domain-containing protein [Flavobacterium agri]NYA69525.1 NYN domain-containing protein [Flavobacterium agri]
MEKNNFNIAVLIDGDNAQPKLLGAMLEEVSKYGKATIRRIYGDWTQQQMNGWKDIINEYSFNPVQKFSYTTGKNSTDSALIIEAMDILHGKNIDGFCIVSSDSDYTGLAKRIREEGIFMMGIGQKKTPKAFVQSCEIFTFSENILAAGIHKQAETAENEYDKPENVDLAFIDKAFDISSTEGEEEVYISKLGLTLRKIDPSFDPRAYGFRNLTQLFRSLPNYTITHIEQNPAVKRVVLEKSKSKPSRSGRSLTRPKNEK